MHDYESNREWRVAGIVFFGLLAIVILGAAARILWPFLSAIIIAAILATVTFPAFRRVRARLHGSSTWAAMTMLLSITFVIIVPAVVLAVLLVQQANALIPHLQSIEAQKIMEKLDLADRLRWVNRFAPGFDASAINPRRLILPVVQNIPGWVAEHGGAMLGSVAGIVIGFGLVLLAAFYFYVEGESILEELSVLSPMPSRYRGAFASKFKDVIDATFLGQIGTSLAQGLTTAIGLAIAGVPAAIFWGAVASIMSLVPVVGAAIVWAPAAIYLFVQGAHGHAFFLAIWGTAIVSSMDHVVRPWAMKGKAQLPAIPLLFSVLGGMEAFGFLGLVIGPLVFSLLATIIEIYKESFRVVDSVDG